MRDERRGKETRGQVVGQGGAWSVNVACIKFRV